MRQTLVSLILMFAASTRLLSAEVTPPDRHKTYGDVAKKEFFKLKSSGEFNQFWNDGDGTLPLEKSLNIVYLETAEKSGRTCYFAVREDRGEVDNVPTFFLCANDLPPEKEKASACTIKRRCLHPNPSIGVGNLKTTPTTAIHSFHEPAQYPSELSLNYEWTESGGNVPDTM